MVSREIGRITQRLYHTLQAANTMYYVEPNQYLSRQEKNSVAHSIQITLLTPFRWVIQYWFKRHQSLLKSFFWHGFLLAYCVTHWRFFSVAVYHSLAPVSLTHGGVSLTEVYHTARVSLTEEGVYHSLHWRHLYHTLK